MTLPYGARSSAVALLEKLADGHPYPLAAMIQLTRRCDLRCRHCYQVERGGEELTADDWDIVLGRLADAGVLFLTFTGGEPTVRDDLVDVVRRARARSFAVKIKTNGFRLPPEVCRELARMAVMEVHFSFYAADAGLHDRVTGCEGSHARVVEAARCLRDLGVRVVLNCPLMSDTFDGYHRVIAFAEAERMEWSLDPGLQVQEDGCRDPAAWRLTEDQQRTILADPRLYRAVDPGAAEGKRRGPVCGVGKAMVAVAPNGDVWPCLLLPERMGNLREEPLERFWGGNPVLERYASIRWTDLEKCSDCEDLAFCSRCHAAALLEDGNLHGPSKSACRTAGLRRDASRCAGGCRGERIE